ncbi:MULTISPECIES: PPK2 family polyphosphate kinase [unclassified Nocardioides]|uniref:PPK2 family polyphosphate kinase n=1 Tax=unclassified Nocardioides TaxID=2615069 RepID=UPI00361BC220
MSTHHLRLPSGPVRLDEIPTDAAPGFDGDKDEAKAALFAMGEELADLQERLFAEGVAAGSRRRLLLVLQGMDTSGKGGTLKHTVGLVDPQGVRITSFKKPTEDELSHDFLWRIRRALPAPGYLGVFDRSHYEDVLIGRVNALAEPEEIERRYDEINAFERELVDDGTVVLKCMLHISRDTQGERLLARLDNPEKHWKYNPADLDARAKWDDYQAAYAVALERTNTECAPWHVVPSDRKWLRNLAVGQLLLESLRGMALHWPTADFDVDAERARLVHEDGAS